MKNGILILIVIFLSCKSQQERECKCVLEDIVTSKTDSTSLKKEKTPLNIDLEGKIASKVKKAIDAEIGGKINVSWKEVKLNKIVEYISNEMPEHNDVMLFFRMKKLIYCEYYERLCRDTSISTSELNLISNNKLEELDAAIENYFSFNKEKPPIPSTKKNTSTKKKTFNLTPKEQTLINFIEEKTGLKYSIKPSTYKINLKCNGEIKSVNSENTLFQFTGGQIELLVNDSQCYIFNHLEIPETMSLGNPKKPLEKSIQNKFQNIIIENTEQVGAQIINCLP